ncbi:GGDEF domain-containing protein [Mycolicibacterium sp. CBM1]
MDEDRGSRRRLARHALRWWWRQPDRFDWLAGYLRARGLGKGARVLMAVVSLLLIFMGAGVLPSRNQSPMVAVVVGVAGFAVGIGFAALWLRGWPTRWQSLAMAYTGSALIAVGCMLQPHPEIALMGCTGMAGIGGYLALFHNSKAITANALVAVTAGTICAVRVAQASHDVVLAGAGLSLVIELNAAVPLAIQAVVHTLGADVVRSNHDPLTGVLNRRAFFERATALVTTPSEDLNLVVVMIDLDDFKRLNDTHGHIAGDQALTAVGWALRQSSGSSAIVGRFGGEEFVVIDAAPSDVAEDIPRRLCAAVAALPQPVTASVGAAVVRWGTVAEPALAIERLIRTADAAMYAAKSSGGNRWQVYRPSTAEH